MWWSSLARYGCGEKWRPAVGQLFFLLSLSFAQAPKEEWRKLTRLHDPHDWDIYATAWQVFVKDLRRYGLAVPDHYALDDK